MLKPLKRMFGRLTVVDITTAQLADAEMLAVIHAADAEHHNALARMYEHRVRRLQSVPAGGEARIPWPPLPPQR